MNSEQFIKFRQMIESEFSIAYTKHPKFCDDFTGASERFIVDELECWRKVNSVAPYHADAILNEEILEALEAYKQGDLKHCLQELAQCGAVILRMMQFVENEWRHNMQYDENAEKYGYEGEMTPLKCDKLTAYKGDVTIPVYGTIADAEVYLKSEADKVIAELEERIADGDRDFEMANHQNECLLKKLRHHKYKRCLAMAGRCRLRGRLFGACGLYEKELWALKWHKRWLELAEKFKEDV